MKRKLIHLIIGILLVSMNATGQDKEWENNVIYSESKVPFYELPDVMMTIEGKRVTTVQEWEQVRRPQIMGMFAGLIYGRIPEPEQPVMQVNEVLSVDKNFLDGKCTLKHLLIKFSNHRGEVKMHMVVYTPNNVAGPVPTLLQLSFSGVESSGDIGANNVQSYGNLNSGLPLIYFLNKGFGVAIIHGGEVVSDENGFGGNSVQRLYYHGNQSLPRADEWGVLGGIAWQASRAMDYLESDAAIDKSKVAILGFSKLGKSALWAAAQDTRFAMAFSQNSGCGGAALWGRIYGENMKYTFRNNRWLCENGRKFVGNEDDLSVDQHMLLAAIAPRPVYITSGIDDNWADPMGEYLSAHFATPVFELYGLTGQPSPERPKLNEPSEDRALSSVVRTSGHGYFQSDWDRYIKCMEFHFKKQGK